MAARPSPRRAALAIACVLGGAFAASDGVAQSLFVIPTESSSSVAVPDDQPLRIALKVRDPVALAKVLGVEPPAAGADVLEYVLGTYPVIVATTSRDWLESTFVIDYRDPNVVKVGAEFAQSLGEHPSAAPSGTAIVKFVSGIMKGSEDRGFDIASQVAVLREGDCSEYAVLTAALARAVGLPARVAMGLALIRHGEQYAAYGHAWAELRVEGRWMVADAALAQLKYPVRYLPFGVLENEGMGYQLDVVRLTPVWVQHVEVLGGAPGDR
jgi:hypothetical protein